MSEIIKVGDKVLVPQHSVHGLVQTRFLLRKARGLDTSPVSTDRNGVPCYEGRLATPENEDGFVGVEVLLKDGSYEEREVRVHFSWLYLDGV